MPPPGGMHGAVFTPLHPDGLTTQTRTNVLTIMGGQTESIRQPEIDWEIKASARPYDGLQELANEFVLGPLNDRPPYVDVIASHTLDVVEAVLGPIIEVDSRTEILWPVVKLTDIGEESLRETADHINVLGRNRSGAVFTADIGGGVAPENARFSFEIRGSKGWLSLTGGHPYGFQAGDLKLTSNVPFTPPDEAVVPGGLVGAAINVGEIYARLARDVRAGSYSTPGFEHALHNARLIEAVRRAAERGQRQKVATQDLEQIETRSLTELGCYQPSKARTVTAL
jgi:predicted dehydrogenase